jgi:hypothetical protein
VTPQNKAAQFPALFDLACRSVQGGGTSDHRQKIWNRHWPFAFFPYTFRRLAITDLDEVANESDQRLLRGVAAQFLMGGMMGALFVSVIILTDALGIEAMIAGTAFPITTLIIFCAGPMLYCAFGAAITGSLFLVSDGVPDRRVSAS